MGADEGDFAGLAPGLESFGEDGGVVLVEAGGGFIQEEDLGIFGECSGEGRSLDLSTREFTGQTLGVFCNS